MTAHRRARIRALQAPAPGSPAAAGRMGITGWVAALAAFSLAILCSWAQPGVWFAGWLP